MGMYIDNSYPGKKHISLCINKAAHILYYRALHVLDCKSLKVLYFLLFYPRVDYCHELG